MSLKQMKQTAMKKENDCIDTLFAGLEGQWDLYEPSRGHSDRFLDKQARRKGKPTYMKPLAIAATLVLFFGIFTFYDKASSHPKELAEMSKQTKQTDSVFTSIIKYEMARMKTKDSEINKPIIADALVQLRAMDADYEKIKSDLAKGGENKQLIHALVANLKTQISFLENVLERLEVNEHSNTKKNENVM